MKKRWFLITLFATLQCVTGDVLAQSLKKHLTIVYDITINKTKRPGGIEETYNGGTKTLFISPGKTRIRLATLMRMESILFTYDSLLREVKIIKESGSNKYQYKLTDTEWEAYNSKYAGSVCDTLTDTVTIAGYLCRKAVVHLSTGEEISTYYTGSISIGHDFIEPAFRSIPGTVLQYEYISKRGSVTFKASQVKREPVSKEVFVIADKGIQIRKYTPRKDTNGNTDIEN